MKYHLFKKLAALGMAASVSLSAITPAFAADDASENSVIESEISDGGNSDDETPEKDEVPPADDDNSNEGEQTPPSNEDNSNKEETPPTSEDNSNKQEETPNNTLEEEKTPETPTVKPDGYGEVTQAGGKGDSFVTLEIVNDGSNKPNPNPNPGGGGEDPDNPGGGGGEDPDNPGGGGEDPDPVIFSAYVPSKLPMKLTEDGTVLTPNNAAIINGVATKGIVVKDIEAHLDYDWIPEDWDADYPDMPVNTKKVGLKLRGDTLSKDGDFSVNAEDWKIPKDSYIDLNMEAKLPPQEIETPTQNSDVAILSFTLDWSGDDTTTGPKWNGGAISPDNPTTTPSKPKAESNDTIVAGGSGDIHITWDSKDNTVTLDSVTSSNTDVASIGNTTGSNGNKTAIVNGLKGGTSTITATLSNGETVTYEVIVYEVGNLDDIKVSVSDKKFNVGDSVTSNDVTASIPLIAPDGSTKTINVKPSVDKKTLQAGSNSLTGTVTVGGQEYPIHFDVAVGNPDDNKSDITAESTDTLVEGETGEVTFTWDTKVNTITLKSITSSDESIATVGTITGADGSKKVTINALAYGKANITATLNNGEIAVFEAEVYKVGNANDIQVTVNNPNLGVGDKVTSKDITVKVPVISPDGDTKYIEKTPSIEDKVLQAGDNTITGTVTAGKSTITISVTVTVEETNVPVSVTNTTYIVGNENNPINFKWNTEGDTITLSNVTSSNTDVATIKTIKGDEGNKTVDLDCLKAGTTNIDLTFSNGATSSYEISVYELGNLDDVKVVVADKEFNAGDTLTSNDVTVKVPLIDGNGDTKMVDMSVDFEDTTLKAGTNDFSFNLSIAGQNCPIHFEVTTELPDDMKSGIKAESNDTLVAGGTGNVSFTWDTKGDTISLTSVTSNNTDVASIGTTTGSEGSKTTTLNALKGGTSTITATLNNGETATFEATVYEMGNPDDIQTTVNNKELSAGDKVTPNDVTVKVPLTSPDGSTKLMEVTPSIEDKALEAGNNTLTGTVTIGGNTYNITIIINIEAHSNPSNGLIMSVQEAQAMGFTFASYQDGLEITGFENKMFKSTINVPEQIGDFKVIRIGNNAFANQTNLKEITLPNTIIEIGNNSFEGCTSLTTFDSNAKLHKIGARAFLNCTKLSSITLNTASDFSMEIVRDALYFSSHKGRKSCDLTISPFIGCNSLEEVTIDGDITSLPPLFTVMIEKNVFDGKDINLPLYDYLNSTDKYYNGQYTIDQFDGDIIVKCPNLEETGSYAFHNTIANNVCLLSNNITTISSGAFYGCPDTSIDIPNGITTIGSYAFYGCKNLETIDIPSSVTTIGSCAFMHCNKLTSITIPEGIKEISFGLFQMCSGLEEIVLPTSLESIGGWAFSSCDKLKNIEIPSTVTTIGEKAFNYWGSTGREFQKILIHKQEGTIIGCPWGATNATIIWTGSN